MKLSKSMKEEIINQIISKYGVSKDLIHEAELDNSVTKAFYKSLTKTCRFTKIHYYLRPLLPEQTNVVITYRSLRLSEGEVNPIGISIRKPENIWCPKMASGYIEYNELDKYLEGDTLKYYQKIANEQARTLLLQQKLIDSFKNISTTKVALKVFPEFAEFIPNDNSTEEQKNQIMVPAASEVIKLCGITA